MAKIAAVKYFVYPAKSNFLFLEFLPYITCLVLKYFRSLCTNCMFPIFNYVQAGDCEGHGKIFILQSCKYCIIR